MAPVALMDNVIAALTVPQPRTELPETHCMSSSSILGVLKSTLVAAVDALAQYLQKAG